MCDVGKLRKVTKKDKDLLFQWANDSECRKNSLNMAQISYEEHCKWFESRINSVLCNMYIYMYRGEPVGQIRIECKDDEGYISYSIAKEHRGKGHGDALLKLVEQEMQGKVKYLTAVVKDDNIASKRRFEENGYGKSEVPEGVFYRKKLE